MAADRECIMACRISLEVCVCLPQEREEVGGEEGSPVAALACGCLYVL